MTQLLSLNSLSNGACFQESGAERIIKDSGSEAGSKVGSFRGNQAGAVYSRLEPRDRRRDSAASEGCPGSLETETLTSASQTSLGEHGGLAPEFAPCLNLPHS